MRDHLRRSAERGTVKSSLLLAGPELPPEAAYLWGWFQRLSRRRGAGMGGPMPISWSDLDAWRRLTAVDPAPWEVELLEQVDVVWLNALLEKNFAPPLLKDLEDSQ